MLSAGGVLAVIHVLPLMVIFAIVGLELAIAFLQAYVFTVLLCIYLNDAISLH
jgi:F-type H+-transporting ATPase subunit a